MYMLYISAFEFRMKNNNIKLIIFLQST